ncbi:hypothetical protein CDAR_318521 [Caerostris darwini]|uniref:Uncharacterized protein n=1 Tax=Caerostris darwini TaxID=1538125 RepID=A0AAV4Q879_9ARAC|nr:hypothetical protein CDAR_318521 [Caerostris darwini]
MLLFAIAKTSDCYKLLRTTVGSAPDSNSIDHPLPRHRYHRSRPVRELFTKRDLFTPDADPFLPDHSHPFLRQLLLWPDSERRDVLVRG